MNYFQNENKLKIGKYYEFYPSKIKSQILMNIRDYVDPSRLHYSKNGVMSPSIMTIDDIYKKEWIHTFQSVPFGYLNEELRNSFCNFLKVLTATSDTSSMIAVYTELGKFLGRYVDELTKIQRKELFNRLADLFINIYKTYVSACIHYTKVSCDIDTTIEEGLYETICKLEYAANLLGKYNTDALAGTLYSFYDSYKIDWNVIPIETIDKNDVFVFKFLCNNANLGDQSYFREFELYSNMLKAKLNMLKEHGRDALINVVDDLDAINQVMIKESEDTIGYGNRSIEVFGDPLTPDSYNPEMDKKLLEEELLHLNIDTIKSYLHKGDDVKISFSVPEQFKMYMKAELNCKMMIVNLKRSENECDMLTIIEYEGHKYLLFLSDTDPDKVFGLSLEEKEMRERELLTIDVDDQLTFSLVVNFD